MSDSSVHPTPGRHGRAGRPAIAAPSTSPRDQTRADRARAARLDRRGLRLRPVRHAAAGMQDDFGWSDARPPTCVTPLIRVGTRHRRLRRRPGHRPARPAPGHDDHDRRHRGRLGRHGGQPVGRGARSVGACARSAASASPSSRSTPPTSTRSSRSPRTRRQQAPRASSTASCRAAGRWASCSPARCRRAAARSLGWRGCTCGHAARARARRGHRPEAQGDPAVRACSTRCAGSKRRRHAAGDRAGRRVRRQHSEHAPIARSSSRSCAATRSCSRSRGS